MGKQHLFTNQLIHESSPYLIQHAHNPVNWYPWGEEALAKAKKENKLLIISIGYAACHWCHVMEKESFEDTLVANIMNQHFISIKVDREERPDVDDVYMTACNLVTGRGGWPLNAFALPDGRPVWAGTYFPKDQWINILNQFANLKEEGYDKLEESADRITKGIGSVDELDIVFNKQEYKLEELNVIGNNFIRQLDSEYGGRSGAPKFPMPNNYEFLLRYAATSQRADVLRATLHTLDKMSEGGIYDHIGGGFARYSVDSFWKVPHFEKMLYDNGQLVSLYADAYRLTKNDKYKTVVEETIDFIQRELSHENGGFYSSLDADSEGVEGKFYVWKYQEIFDILKDIPERDAILEYFSIEKTGNWEHGQNILLVQNSMEAVANKHGMKPEQLSQAIQNVKPILLSEREHRVRPGLDDKILTSWNALMIKAYVDAYKAIPIPEYLESAIRNANFLLRHQKDKKHRLNRNYKDGVSSINAFLDDYALLIQGLIALYEVSFDSNWLAEANALCIHVINHFFKENNSMFYYTSDLDPPLVARKSEINDNVIPASNSVMARNLKKLGELYYNQEYLDIAAQMMANMKSRLVRAQQPSFYSNWCQLFYEYVHPAYEIAIVGPDANQIRDQFHDHFLPNVIFLGGVEEGDLPLLKLKSVEGETNIYVCQNKTCKFPVQTVEDALKLINDDQVQ